ncbi:MAG: hypothetical protein ACTSR5_10605 [Promethearchaeota archaeon]
MARRPIVSIGDIMSFSMFTGIFNALLPIIMISLSNPSGILISSSFFIMY